MNTQSSTGEQRAQSTTLSPAAFVIIGALILCVPAIANGFPFLFFDTLHYYAGGQKIISLLSDAFHLNAAQAATAAIEPSAPVSAASAAESGQTLMSYMGGRSPYYGAPLYILTGLFGAWAPALLQAVIGAWLIFVFARAMGVGRIAYLGLMAAMSAFTALPWIATFLMPDIFGGYAILAAGLLIFFPRDLTRGEQLCCFVLLAGAMTVHTINLLLIAAAIPAAALALLASGKRLAQAVRALAPLALAVPLALGATLAYPAAAKIALGKPLPQPPFLMARIVADGPGRAYLREACTRGEAYALCAFTDLPLDSGDDILWEPSPAKGVYFASSLNVQQELIAEQTRFVLAVITHKPLEQVRASLQNWGQQLVSFDLDDLRGEPQGWRAAADAGAVDGPLLPFLDSAAGDDRYPFWLFNGVNAVALLAAIIFLSHRLTRVDLRATNNEQARTFIAFAVFAIVLIVINAAIAGALSGVFNRYQVRVIWIIPLLALLAACRFPPAVKPLPR